MQLRVKNKSTESGDLKEVMKSYDLKELVISKIPIHSGNNVMLINIKDIVYIKSEDTCTLFKTGTSEKYTSSKELSDFEFILENHPYLVRVNKSTYVNLNFVSSYSKGLTCFLTMKDGTEIEIPRRVKSKMLAVLSSNR